MKKILSLLLVLSYTTQSLCIPGLKKAMSAKSAGLEAVLEEKPKAHIAYEQINRQITELPIEIQLIFLKDYLSKEEQLSQEMFNLAIDLRKRNRNYKEEFLKLIIIKGEMLKVESQNGTDISISECLIDQYVNNYNGTNKAQLKEELGDEVNKIISEYNIIYHAIQKEDFCIVQNLLDKDYISKSPSLMSLLLKHMKNIIKKDENAEDINQKLDLLIKIMQKCKNLNINYVINSIISKELNKTLKAIIDSGFKPNIDNLETAVIYNNLEAAKIILKTGLKIGKNNKSFKFYTTNKFLRNVGFLNVTMSLLLTLLIKLKGRVFDNIDLIMTSGGMFLGILGIAAGTYITKQYNNPIFEMAKHNPAMLKLLLKYSN